MRNFFYLDIFNVRFLFNVFAFLSEEVLSQNVENVGAENAIVNHLSVLAIRKLDNWNVLKKRKHHCLVNSFTRY